MAQESAALAVEPFPGSPRIPEAGVVAAGVYAAGRRVRDIAIEEAGEWARKPGHVVWIGLFEPSPELLRRVQEQFDLHELAIEDAEQPHQRPKIEQYGEASSSWRARRRSQAGRIAFGETHLFVGRGYVVSVRHGASTSYRRCASAARPARSCSPTARTTSSTPSWISSSTITCRCSRRSTPRSRRSRTRCWPPRLRQPDIERLYMLRRDLLRLRNAVLPLVDVCHRLEHAEAMPVDAVHAAALPRRDRPCPPRAGGDRFAARGAGLRLRGEPDDRPGAADARSPAGSPPGPPSSPCRPRSPASTA